jgi:hypothetical protein
MCNVAMVQCVPLLRLHARGECHQCDAPCPGHPQRRLKNGSLRPAKSAPIIYSLAVALRAVIRCGQRQLNRLLGGRGGTRSLGLQRRVFTPDEGSPHFERHWRYRGRATRRSSQRRDIYASPKDPTRSLFLEPSISDQCAYPKRVSIALAAMLPPVTYRPQHLSKQTLWRCDRSP